jgi:hypothetical protein
MRGSWVFYLHSPVKRSHVYREVQKTLVFQGLVLIYRGKQFSRLSHTYGGNDMGPSQMVLIRRAAVALASSLLNDEHGISERSYRQLKILLGTIGKVPHLENVDEVDGRFFIPKEEHV